MEMKNKPKTSQFVPPNNRKTDLNYQLVTKEDIHGLSLEGYKNTEQVDKAVNRIMTSWNNFLSELCGNNKQPKGSAGA